MLKLNLLVSAAFLFITIHLFGQYEIKMESKVISATVFSESAIVTREAKVNLSKTGEYQLFFPNLSADFSGYTVKVSGKGTAKVKIIDVKTEEKHTAEIKNEILKKEQKIIDSLKLLDQIAIDKISVLQSQKSFIESLKAESPKQINQNTETTKISIQDWQNMVQFFSNTLNNIFTELRNENSKRQEISNQIKTIEANIKNIKTGHDKSYNDICVTVLVEEPGNLTLLASYSVYEASWIPVYDARVFTENKNLELSCFGMIKQNTGEDWKNISLTLSTADPTFHYVFPAISPLYLQVKKTKLDKGIVSNLLDSDGYSSGSVEKKINIKNTAEYEVEFLNYEIKNKEVFTKFIISAKANIPSDNSTHKVHIITQPMYIALEYKAVPKLTPGTYLNCKVVNNAELTLSSGQMSIYLGDDFVNKFTIANITPGDTFDLSLGLDDGIKAERKMINRFVENKGLFGGKKSITYEYEIIVINNKSTEKNITINDQLPISQNDDIKVELLYPKESELVLDKQKIITWKLTLKSGEKKILPLKYSVVFPDNIEIVDLE